MRAGGGLGQAERAFGEVAQADAVVTGDREVVVGAEAQEGDVGGEQLAELHGGTLDDHVELHVLPEGGDDLREARGTQERARGVALRVVDAVAQLGVLAPEAIVRAGHSASTETEVMWKPPGPMRRANSP